MAALRGRQLAQVDLGISASTAARRVAGQVPDLVLGVGPIDADEQQGRERDRVHQQRNDVERERVRPVEIVEHKHEAALSRQRQHQVA